MEGKVRAKTPVISLEFLVACRQMVTQEIPIVNPTDHDWTFSVRLLQFCMFI